MELRDIVAMLRHSMVAIIVLAALGLGVGGVATIVTTPVYQAQNTVMVSVVAGADVNDLNLGANFVARQVPTYAELARSPKVLDPVVKDLDLQVSAQQLRGSIQAAGKADTALIMITVTNVDPELAADIANAVAFELNIAVQETSPSSAQGGSTVSIVSISPAAIPSAPYAPSPTTNLGVGVFSGLLLGIGWAVLRRALDTRVRFEADLRALVSAPVLGVISDDGKNGRGQTRQVVAEPLSLRAEEFRQLRTNLQFIDATQRPRSLVITSARSGEGKSSTAIDLAFALAEAEMSVCLVDADLRRPAIAKRLNLEGSAGLTSVLIGRATTQDVLQTVNAEGLQVVTSGLLPPNPSELLGSATMAQFIADLETRFDIVLLDCVPLLPVTDSAVLAKITGGALLVVGSSKVTRDQVEEAVAKLGTIDSRLLGTVLNMATRHKGSTSAYRYERGSDPLSESRWPQRHAPRG